jgi:hypothetical protein
MAVHPPASLKFPDCRKPDFRETVYDEMMGAIPAKLTDEGDDEWADSLEAFAKNAKEKYQAGYYDDCEASRPSPATEKAKRESKS